MKRRLRTIFAMQEASGCSHRRLPFSGRSISEPTYLTFLAIRLGTSSPSVKKLISPVGYFVCPCCYGVRRRRHSSSRRCCWRCRRCRQYRSRRCCSHPGNAPTSSRQQRQLFQNLTHISSIRVGEVIIDKELKISCWQRPIAVCVCLLCGP